MNMVDEAPPTRRGGRGSRRGREIPAVDALNDEH